MKAATWGGIEVSVMAQPVGTGAGNLYAWIGDRYAERRILILGESSWGVGDTTNAAYIQHWLDHPNYIAHTDCEICSRVGGPSYPRDRLNDALTTMMLDWRKVTDKARRDAWAAIAFTNFILRQITSLDANERPTAVDWEEATRAFPARLAELKPRVCLVLDNPSGRLLSAAGPLLDRAGVKVVRLAHLTMLPAPTRAERSAAWRALNS